MRERLTFEMEMENLGLRQKPHPNLFWSQKLGWGQYMDQITQLLGLNFSPFSVGDAAFVDAVKKWQAHQGYLNPNGVIGPKTWEHLHSLFSKEKEPKQTAGSTDIELIFMPTANKDAVSQYSLQVIQEILKKANLKRAVITSTVRTPEHQALIMYNNCKKYGVKAQKKLYGAAGDKVVDIYLDGKLGNKKKKEIIETMTATIYEMGPTKVSRHCGDPHQVNVIDIAPSSIADKSAFESILKTDSRVKAITPHESDPAYHLEILQPKQIPVT